MDLTKEQWQKIGGIIITAILAIAAVLGWWFPVEGPEARLREKISIDARDDAFLWNGADLYMYSDDHTTQKFHVDGATGNVTGAGSTTLTGGQTNNSWLLVAATPAATATPQVTIKDVGAGVPFEIRNASATPVVSVEGDYDWDFKNNSLTNIGAAGTDFSETGGLALADGIDLNANLDLDGNADEVQLAVTGYTTQTNDLVQIDGGLVDIGGGTYTVADGDNDLGVNGDLEVNGSVVLGSANYPLEFASAARIVYVGTTSAFTGTTTVVSGTHGCTTAVVLALCQMQNPDDDAGDAFLCIGSISGSTVTIGAMDTAGDAATEASVVADYIIIGY